MMRVSTDYSILWQVNASGTGVTRTKGGQGGPEGPGSAAGVCGMKMTSCRSWRSPYPRMRAAGRQTPATLGHRISTMLLPSAILLYNIHLLVSIAVILQKLNFVFRCVILVIFTCYMIFNSVLVSNTAFERNDLSLFIVNIRERE